MVIAGLATTRTRERLRGLARHVTHEMFHAWNGKRLRPVELGPFDYEHEVLTRKPVGGRRASRTTTVICWRIARDCSTRDEFLSGLSEPSKSVQTTPGRLLQSVELASSTPGSVLPARTKTPERQHQLLLEGASPGFLLDARIRRLTNGAQEPGRRDARRLCEVSGARGFTPDQFREVAEQVAGTPLTDFWKRSVKGTQELRLRRGAGDVRAAVRPAAATGAARRWVSRTRNESGRL